MKGLDVAVVGAGISGLTVALALAKSGQSVRVYEATPKLGDIGAGITLSPNAMRGLDYVGVGARVVATGQEPSTQIISHWQHGGKVLTVNRNDTLQTYGSAYVYIHRADLHEILLEEAKQCGVSIHLGKQLSDIEYAQSRPTMSFADGSQATAELVVAADGLKSQARNLFNPEPPYFTGHIAYRALAPASPEIQALIDQPGMHIGPGKMVVRYPLRKNTLLNLVFFARQDGWTEDGWSIPASIDELFELYDGWCTDVRRLIKAVNSKTVFKWAINAHRPLKSGWSLENKVALIGDSAHAMTPFLGQGAATAIEDAIMFSRAFEAYETTGEALKRFFDSRFERTKFIQHESNENADRLQGDGAELYGLDSLINEETLGLFAYDCTMESI